MKLNFNSYINSDDIAFWCNLIVANGKLATYEKGEYFANIGHTARHVGYIASGTMKYLVYSDDGIEHVIGLEFAGEFVADFPFSLSAEKSRVDIIADSRCEVYIMDIGVLTRMMASDNSIRERVSRTTQDLFSQTYDRYIDLYCLSPQQRYNKLIRRHPDLLSLFSLKDIASFLNITPTHLSRLRKNI